MKSSIHWLVLAGLPFILLVFACLRLQVPTATAQGGASSGRVMGIQADPVFAREMAQDEESLRVKKEELKSLLSGSGMDEPRVRSLETEISRIECEMAKKRLAYAIEYKKENPEWQPRPGNGNGQGRRGKKQNRDAN